MPFVAKCMQLVAGLEERAMKQFKSEVYSLTHLIHMNIVQIYDYFNDGQYLFMIIEYCDKGNLMTVVKKQQKSSSLLANCNYPSIRKIMIEVLSALSYCHDVQHISHHDIKPSNILIDSFGRAKLCDFGISYFVETHKIQTFDEEVIHDSNRHPSVWAEEKDAKQNTSGSLLFMSPQLLLCSLNGNKKYDMFAADMWAFGVTAFYLVSGKFPFIAHSRKDLLEQQIFQCSLENLAVIDGKPKEALVEKIEVFWDRVSDMLFRRLK